MITKEAIEAVRHAVEGECDGLDIDEEQARSILQYALAAMPAPAVRGTVAAFEDAYPELYYHIAKGKICAGEPLYGAIITTMGNDHRGDPLYRA